MAISPLKHHYYNYQQPQQHQYQQQYVTGMPFSVTDILHQNYANNIVPTATNALNNPSPTNTTTATAAAFNAAGSPFHHLQIT